GWGRGGPPPGLRGPRGPGGGHRMMRVEEFDDAGQHVVRIELPGIDPDRDVEIHVRDHVLSIAAERREALEEREKNRYRSEFRYGRFERHVPLPPGATSDDVRATYKDGILEVRVPLDAGRAAATKVPVQRA